MTKRKAIKQTSKQRKPARKSKIKHTRTGKVLTHTLYAYVEPGNAKHANSKAKNPKFGTMSAYVNSLIAKDRGVALHKGSLNRGKQVKVTASSKSKQKPKAKKSSSSKSKKVSTAGGKTTSKHSKKVSKSTQHTKHVIVKAKGGKIRLPKGATIDTTKLTVAATTDAVAA